MHIMFAYHVSSIGGYPPPPPPPPPQNTLLLLKNKNKKMLAFNQYLYPLQCFQIEFIVQQLVY